MSPSGTINLLIHGPIVAVIWNSTEVVEEGESQSCTYRLEVSFRVAVKFIKYDP
jgi:hypothetical protein